MTSMFGLSTQESAIEIHLAGKKKEEEKNLLSKSSLRSYLYDYNPSQLISIYCNLKATSSIALTTFQFYRKFGIETEQQLRLILFFFFWTRPGAMTKYTLHSIK